MYLGIFLEPESVARLRALVPPRTGDTLQYHHVTLQFKPSASTLAEAALHLGEPVQIKVTEIVADSECSAVRVKIDRFREFAPPGKDLHITCSHSSSVKPAYSNELLARSLSDNTVRAERASLTLTGRLGYFEKGKVRFQ